MAQIWLIRFHLRFISVGALSQSDQTQSLNFLCQKGRSIERNAKQPGFEKLGLEKVQEIWALRYQIFWMRAGLKLTNKKKK